MDTITKRFLRTLLTTSLPSGIIWFVFVSFDNNWKTSVIIGFIFGLIVGVGTAFIQAREFSKSTYPINLNFSRGIHAEQNEFQPVGFPMFWGYMIIVMITLFFINLFTQSTASASFLVWVALILYAFINWLISYTFTRLHILEDGLELRSLFYKIAVNWEDVERIEQRGRKWLLICQDSKVSGLLIVSYWLKFTEADKIILLDTFTTDFLESNLAKSILHYKNQVNIVSVV